MQRSYNSTTSIVAPPLHGCFARATGCASVGEPSTYWSWFAGYSWQVELCSACREHLGWLFRNEGHAFHCFVLDRLVEVER